MQSLPGIVQGIRDPLGTILQLLTGVLSHFIATARADLNSELSRYLFTTVDPTASGIRPLTSNPAIARLNGSLALIADVLVGVRPPVHVAAEHLRALDPRALRAPPGDPARHGGDRDGARIDLLHPDGDRPQQRDRRRGCSRSAVR